MGSEAQDYQQILDLEMGSDLVVLSLNRFSYRSTLRDVARERRRSFPGGVISGRLNWQL